MDHLAPTDPAHSSHGSWPSLSVASLRGEAAFDPPWISASPSCVPPASCNKKRKPPAFIGDLPIQLVIFQFAM